MASIILTPRPDNEPQPKWYRVLVKIGWVLFWIDVVLMVVALGKAAL